MRAISKMFVTALVIFSITGYCACAQDAGTILKNMDDVLYAASDLTAVNTIILIDKNGKQQMREAIVRQKGSDKRIMRFTSPASQAGIAVLALPDDVMYLYLPAYGKERRISASVKNQDFAGTDFSYDDMEPIPYAEKYTPVSMKTEANVYVLELKPKKQSDYSRIIVHINKSHYYPEIMEYYDRGDNKVKVASYTFRQIGKYWNASEIEMTDLKKNHITKMQMSDVKYDTGLTDDEFTVRKLRQ